MHHREDLTWIVKLQNFRSSTDSKTRTSFFTMSDAEERGHFISAKIGCERKCLKMLISPLHLFRTLKFLHFLELGVNFCLSSRVVSSLQMNGVRVGRSRRHNITLTTKLDKNLSYHDGRQDSPFRKQHHLKSRRRLFPYINTFIQKC